MANIDVDRITISQALPSHRSLAPLGSEASNKISRQKDTEKVEKVWDEFQADYLRTVNRHRTINRSISIVDTVSQVSKETHPLPSQAMQKHSGISMVSFLHNLGVYPPKTLVRLLMSVSILLSKALSAVRKSRPLQVLVAVVLGAYLMILAKLAILIKTNLSKGRSCLEILRQLLHP